MTPLSTSRRAPVPELRCPGHRGTQRQQPQHLGLQGQRFHMYLSDEQTVKTADVRDMEEGELMLTKRTLDVGVQGQGFIPDYPPRRGALHPVSVA
ncbi:MAG: hypothetical protein R2857_01175 [Vampirovibrionales bacterium]